MQPFEYDPGDLGPHEVDVQVTHCGIRHTDAAMVDNDFGFSQYPLVLGHEAILSTVVHKFGNVFLCRRTN